MADVHISKRDVERYVRSCLDGKPDNDIPLSDEERQVALVLAGFNTLGHANMLGISDDARVFVAEHWPGGLTC